MNKGLSNNKRNFGISKRRNFSKTICEIHILTYNGCSIAINTAMRELFLQIVYGRSQSAFSEGGLSIGAGLEDLGKGHRSQVGTIYSTKVKGPRYLELAEGYIVELGLDEEDQIIGYKYVHIGKMMDNIKAGIEPTEAIEKASGTYGRFDEAVKKIDPRKQ